MVTPALLASDQFPIHRVTQIHQKSPQIHGDTLPKVSEEIESRAAVVAQGLEMQPHARDLAPAIRPHPAWQGQEEPL